MLGYTPRKKMHKPSAFIALLCILILQLVLFMTWSNRTLDRQNITYQSVSQKININTADAQTLTLLPRIGPALADAIVTYRNTYGPFTTGEQLENVSRIGPKTRAFIEPFITFDLPATSVAD
ncbi:helix-hairpin-helix domain-containing protein [Planctomycetota bacterium]|nr:helix-hairpin-helix domain-containing protein [Planctomycetota bacterium]